MNKSWKHWPGENCKCGDSVEAFTGDDLEEGEGRDGDDARCVDCGATGMVSVVNDEAYISWDES